MKKISLLVIIFISVKALACPICGCGVGNFYFGLLPDFKNHFVGVRYQYMRYHTQIKGEPTEFSNDYYRTAEVWGGISLGSKWQVLGFVPYHINVQNTDDGIKREDGIGDITLLANYKVFAKSKIDTKKKTSFAQDLWIGGGVKLPSGKYNFDVSDVDAELGDINAQMGTGSMDFLLNSRYDIRINNFGVNTAVSYKINTHNSDQFNFGNRFSANSFGYYSIPVKAVSIAPNAGVLYEHAGANKLDNSKVELTGGYVALAVTGVEMNYKKINIGANVQLPFAQDFAVGQTKAKTRGLVHVTLSF